ncbi:tetratricopeptide repeat protein [Chitinibacter bivalviorum]|uniref:Tetratricopeptide repeat protein n=1 Tax=Chitinibacter bivalviorum TaxID=2739434 RepID=A0A7H9BJA2_9NEIS|nr:tetratricopeptide repeat protein [Chitinibacter bivalviorum]QLG88735.1 tetratricopeptide repeat protein [Chitinibacter bivalviorum]
MSERDRLILELQTIAKEAHCGSPPSPLVALELLKSVKGDVYLTALASAVMGHAWQHISEHDKAQMAFSSAIEGFRAAKRARDETEAMILLGTSHLLSGEPMRALDHWSNALQIARKINDRELCIRVYLGVGQVYIGFGDMESALQFNELALEMARRLNHDERKGEALLNVASDAYRLGRYSYTLQCIAEAEKLLETTISNKIWSAEVVYFRGRVHAQQGHYAQAKLELETAYQLSEQNDNLWGKAHALTALSETLLKMGDGQTGQVLEDAHQLAKMANLAPLLLRCSQALITWYEQCGDVSASLPHYNYVLQNEQAIPVKVTAVHAKQITQLLARSRVRCLARDFS